MRPNGGVGPAAPGVLAPDRNGGRIGVPEALQVPQVLGHAAGRDTHPDDRSAGVLRVHVLDDRMPVHVSVPRNRRRVRRDQRARPGRRTGSVVVPAGRVGIDGKGAHCRD